MAAFEHLFSKLEPELKAASHTKALRYGKALESADAAVKDVIHEGLPPVPKGHMRLYRGTQLDESGSMLSTEEHLAGRHFNANRAETAGLWFADTPEYAEMYSKGGGKLHYADVPLSDAAKYDTTAMDPEYIASLRAGESAIPGEYLLPRNVASSAKEYRAVIGGLGAQETSQVRNLLSDPQITDVLGPESTKILEGDGKITRHFGEEKSTILGKLRDAGKSIADEDDFYGAAEQVVTNPQLAQSAETLHSLLSSVDLNNMERMPVTGGMFAANMPNASIQGTVNHYSADVGSPVVTRKTNVRQSRAAEYARQKTASINSLRHSSARRGLPVRSRQF